MNPARRATLAAMVAALAGAATGASGARARGELRRLVVVRLEPDVSDGDILDAVLASLAKRGFAEGREIEVRRVVIDVRGVESGRRFVHVKARIRQEAEAWAPDLFLTEGTAFTEAIRQVTRTVPIVASMADPVGSGLARSLARPGGNVTGLADGVEETAGKAIELLGRLVPGLSRLAVYHGAGSFGTRYGSVYARAAREAGIEVETFPAADGAALVAAIRRAPSRRLQAGFLAWSEGDPAIGARVALDVRLPLMGQQEGATDAGCLASFYASDPDRAERFAAVAEKVLRGGDPAVIPFQFPTLFRLVLNRRTATALGLAIPPDLLLRADRVIE